MKQRITKEQLNELTDKEAKVLAEWCHIKRYGKREIVEWENGEKTEMFFDLLTIGQMIEFLNSPIDTSKKLQIDILDEYHDSDEYYHCENQVMSNNVGVFWYGKELCDALWDTVKEVLKSGK